MDADLVQSKSSDHIFFFPHPHPDLSSKKRMGESKCSVVKMLAWKTFRREEKWRCSAIAAACFSLRESPVVCSVKRVSCIFSNFCNRKQRRSKSKSNLVLFEQKPVCVLFERKQVKTNMKKHDQEAYNQTEFRRLFQGSKRLIYFRHLFLWLFTSSQRYDFFIS